MQIKILGDLTVIDDHGHLVPFAGRRRRQRSRELFSTLSLYRVSLSAAQIKRLLWDTEQDKTSALTTLINTTRREIPKGWLITDRNEGKPDTYRLRNDVADIVDAHSFRTALKLAQRAHAKGDLPTAIRLYREGLNLWRTGERSDLLPDLPDTFAMRENREHLLRDLRCASDSFVDARMDAGDRSIGLADDIQDLMLAHQPINSYLLQRRMQVLYHAGRKAEALAAYWDAKRFFAAHFGTTPGPHLARLRDQIADDDPSLALPTPRPSSTTLRTVGPTVRGIRDAALGGKDGTQVDRELLNTLNHESANEFGRALIESRQALTRMVKRLCGAGIYQFLVLGPGLPAPAPHQQVHEIAQTTTPGARVLYIDADPVVAAHARALLTDGGRIIFRQARLTETDQVLYEAGKHFDLRHPVAVVAADSLTYIGCRDADLGTNEVAELLDAYMSALPDGSALALINLTGDGLDNRVRSHLDATAPHAELPCYLRSAEQIQQLYGRLTMLAPGLVTCSQWRSRRSAPADNVRILAGLAVKGALRPPLSQPHEPDARTLRPAASVGLRCQETVISADSSLDITFSRVAS
ncbi:SAM-dependent methyltransferase [Actinomadura sp. NPDC048955]|uniref:SAM-dependent methyltransferase n=1 Tax=Actinomadura sp. NPDC048955 TaxID=3158228 RepID=UPI003403D9D1